jgi:HAD superfamily phosphoserine phosphatase-like hydrolase
VGLGEDAMVELSNRAIDAELAKPLERQTFLTSRGEEIAVERGIRMIHAIRELFRLLDANGIEVWICSATNIWTVREFAARYGVPRDRVIGNRVRVVDGVLTDEIIEPVMFKEGKRAAIEREIGVRPTIVGGDSDTDFGMLEFAEFPLFLDTGTDSAYIEHATRNNWNVVTRHKLKVEESDG